MSDETGTTSEVGDAIRELAHVVRTEDEIEGIALQVDDLWNRVQAHREATTSEHLAWERGHTWGINDEQNGTLTRNPYPAQIAAPVPAEQPAVGSVGRGGSGGLGERLRALVAGPHPDMLLVRTAEEVWLAIVEQVDEVEAAYRVADAEIARLTEFHDHYRAQVEAIRGQIAYEARHGDAITRCNLVAERFQTVLDSVTKPEETNHG